MLGSPVSVNRMRTDCLSLKEVVQLLGGPAQRIGGLILEPCLGMTLNTKLFLML